MSIFSDKMSGKAKQMAGRMTDNKSLQAKGKIQEMKAKTHGKARDIHDEIDSQMHKN